jgi:hypothetical protein
MTIFFNEAKSEELRKRYDNILIQQVKACTEPGRVMNIDKWCRAWVDSHLAAACSVIFGIFEK